jgi:hypothetical protein
MKQKFMYLWVISFFSLISIAKAQSYDVQVILDKIVCKKAVELWPDTQDDLFGKIVIQSYVVKNSSGVLTKSGIYTGTPDFYNSLSLIGSLPTVMWEKPRTNPLKLATGQSVLSGASLSLTNLSLSQLLSFEFLVGGFVDEENVIDIRYQPCTSCGFNFASGSSGVGQALNYRLVKLYSYQTQIKAISKGTSKFLIIGDDQYFQLDFFEGDQNSAHVQFLFKIKVTNK